MHAYLVGCGSVCYRNGGSRTDIEVYKNPVLAIREFLAAWYIAVQHSDDYSCESESSVEKCELPADHYKCSCEKNYQTYHVYLGDKKEKPGEGQMTIEQYFENVKNKNFKCKKCKDNIQFFGNSIRDIAKDLKNKKSYGGYDVGEYSLRLDVVKLNMDKDLLFAAYGFRT